MSNESPILKITWCVDDGYVTGDRPQITTIHLQDLADELGYSDHSDEMLEKIVYEYIREDFDQRVAPHLKTNLDTIKTAIFDHIKNTTEGIAK